MLARHARHAGAALRPPGKAVRPCVCSKNTGQQNAPESADNHPGVCAAGASILGESSTLLGPRKKNSLERFADGLTVNESGVLLTFLAKRVRTHPPPQKNNKPLDPCLQHERGVLVQHGGPTGAPQVGGAAEGVREAASGAFAKGDPGV